MLPCFRTLAVIRAMSSARGDTHQLDADIFFRILAQSCTSSPSEVYQRLCLPPCTRLESSLGLRLIGDEIRKRRRFLYLA